MDTFTSYLIFTAAEKGKPKWTTGKVTDKTPLSIPKIIITVVGILAVIVAFHYLGVFN